MFADGTSIDVHSDADQMATAVQQFAGPQEAAGYRALRDWLNRLYRTEFEDFIAANFDSPLSMLTGSWPGSRSSAAFADGRRWSSGTSATRGCGGSSPSNPSMPGLRRKTLWRSMR